MGESRGFWRWHCVRSRRPRYVSARETSPSSCKRPEQRTSGMAAWFKLSGACFAARGLGEGMGGISKLLVR
jgi:hypothetical protein